MFPERTSRSWTKIAWPPSEPAITISDARNWLGVYGDTSLDGEVQACLDAAVEKVSAHVGFRISESTVTDYFRSRRPRRMVLSEAGIDVSTIAVKYYDADNAEQTLSGDDWFFDASAKRGTVVVKRGVELPETGVEVENPWFVTYSSALSDKRGSPVVGRVKLAVRVATEWFWRARDNINSDAKALDRTLYSMLGAAQEMRTYADSLAARRGDWGDRANIAAA